MDQELIKRLREEIQKDPDHKGYAGKSAAEIAKLMNEPTITKSDILQPDLADPVIEEPVEDPTPGTKIGEKVDIKDAPSLKLLVGIPEVANVITEQQVAEALK